MGKKLFIGNLAFSTTDADLRELFSTQGTCVSASVVMDRTTGRSRGFGFVEMSSDEEAQRAIEQLGGRDLQGRAIRVSEATERSERGPSSRPAPSRPSFTPEPFSPSPRFRKEGGSRRGIRARKRSL